MYSYKVQGQNFNFKTQEDVFYPTNTSELLITASLNKIKKPGRILDLGCGVGLIGITLAKLGLVKSPLCASDLSQSAVRLTCENALDHGCQIDARVGSIMEPWSNEKFDYIINDVPGISEEVAAFSRWFPKSVPCASGADGIRLVSQALEQASDYLNPNGFFIFPVLSLSDTNKLLSVAQKRFKHIEKLLQRMWSLPEEMKPHLPFLKKLQREDKVQLQEKFGMILWYTEVYAASN